MARNEPNAATEALEEIDGFFDRIANWATENQSIAWGVVGGILGIALIASIVSTVQTSSREEASQAVGEAQFDYLKAMGAPDLAASFVEPANPEAARATREEFAAKLLEAADAHAGTAAAAAGRVEAAGILRELEDAAGARAALEAAIDEAPSASALQATALMDLAALLEATSASEASAAYERASEIDDFPGAAAALAHAARTALDADDKARALALYEQMETRAAETDGEIMAPAFVTARLREARAAASNAVE